MLENWSFDHMLGDLLLEGGGTEIMVRGWVWETTSAASAIRSIIRREVLLERALES